MARFAPRVMLLLAAISIAAVADVRNLRDFPPFEMTIEFWLREAVSYPDGRTEPRTDTYRVIYWDRRNWTFTRIDFPKDPERYIEGRMCRAGKWHWYDARSGWQLGDDDPAMCNGVTRWLAYGIAWWHPWQRTPGPERHQVTLTDPGERVIYNLRTGLPLLYEATSRRTGEVGSRETYRLDRFLDGRGS